MYLLYREVGADEMLFANKNAKLKLGRHGPARDIIELKDLAEQRGLFGKEDSKAFLLDLRDKIRYRPSTVDEELRRYL